MHNSAPCASVQGLDLPAGLYILTVYDLLLLLLAALLGLTPTSAAADRGRNL